MDLQNNQACRLAYILVSTADYKTGLTDLDPSVIEAEYQKAGETALTVFVLNPSNTRHVGKGIYEVLWPAGYLDTDGPFRTVLQSSDSLPYYREDWVGNPVTAAVATDLTEQITVLEEATSLVSAKLGNYSGLPGDGNNVRDDITALTEDMGMGGYSVTVTVEDGEGFVLSGVTVQVRNEAGTGVLSSLLTSYAGTVVFLLPNGIYSVYLAKAGIDFADLPKSMTVSGDTEFTFTGTRQLPLSMGDPAHTVVFGWVTGPDAQPAAQCSISFTPIIQSTTSDGGIMSAAQVERLLGALTVSLLTDNNGYFEVSLIPNAKITPTSTKYAVAFGTGELEYVTVPEVGPVNITTLI